jgi:hypothetical protein
MPGSRAAVVFLFFAICLFHPAAFALEPVESWNWFQFSAIDRGRLNVVLMANPRFRADTPAFHRFFAGPTVSWELKPGWRLAGLYWNQQANESNRFRSTHRIGGSSNWSFTRGRQDIDFRSQWEYFFRPEQQDWRHRHRILFNAGNGRITPVYGNEIFLLPRQFQANRFIGGLRIRLSENLVLQPLLFYEVRHPSVGQNRFVFSTALQIRRIPFLKD